LDSTKYVTKGIPQTQTREGRSRMRIKNEQS